MKITREEALKEAQRRWGVNCAWISDPQQSKSGLFEVASGTFGYYLKGSGDSWESAFADADKKEKP